MSISEVFREWKALGSFGVPSAFKLRKRLRAWGGGGVFRMFVPQTCAQELIGTLGAIHILHTIWAHGALTCSLQQVTEASGRSLWCPNTGALPIRIDSDVSRV